MISPVGVYDLYLSENRYDTFCRYFCFKNKFLKKVNDRIYAFTYISHYDTDFYSNQFVVLTDFIIE